MRQFVENELDIDIVVLYEQLRQYKTPDTVTLAVLVLFVKSAKRENALSTISSTDFLLKDADGMT
jgi:hypothetical protein